MFKVFLVDMSRHPGRHPQWFSWNKTQFTVRGAPDGGWLSHDCGPQAGYSNYGHSHALHEWLGLSRKVAKALPWINIIILSGYDDFEYAQQAIDIGVKQYLLKPVTPRKLEEALNAMAVSIKKARELQADTALLQAKLASTERKAREQLVTRLLEGRAGPDDQEEAVALSIRLDAPRYLVMMLGEVAPETRLGLMGCINRLVEGEDNDIWCTVALESPALLLAQSAEETAAWKRWRNVPMPGTGVGV